MIAIVAADEKWGIGLEGRLPWHIPGELGFFKEKTTGNTIIMGRKTLESLPGGKPLPGRRNIVLTRDRSSLDPSVESVTSPEELFGIIRDSDSIFLIGGEQIFTLLIPYCSKAYVTRVNGVFDTDTYFPDLDHDPDWQLTETSETTTASNGISYVRCVYENKSPQRYRVL